MPFRTTDQLLNREYNEAFTAGGKKTFAAAATPEVLTATSTPCVKVWLQALSTNTKPIHFATIAEVTNDFPGLSAGDNAIIHVSDVNLIYGKAEANGEGVSWEAIV